MQVWSLLVGLPSGTVGTRNYGRRSILRLDYSHDPPLTFPLRILSYFFHTYLAYYANWRFNYFDISTLSFLNSILNDVCSISSDIAKPASCDYER